MKKIFALLFLLSAFTSHAQRTMFGGQNNYVAPEVQGRIITTDLLLYLDAGNTTSYSGSGTTWYDLSTNVNHGTLATASMANTASNPKKFTFNGTSNYVSFTPSKLNVPYTGKTVVVAAKMDPNFGTNVYRALFGNSSAYSRNFNFYIYQNGTGYQLHFADGGNNAFSNVLTLATNQWYVFATTQENNTVKFFVNGVMVSSTSGPLSQYQTSTEEYVGKADNFWYGDINSFFIYKRGLSEVEILQNFKALKSSLGL
jgi:hypothetical protein